MYAKEILGGEWYGVKIPSAFRAFDCRGDELVRSPWGTILWSSEKAEVDLGLRGENRWDATTPLSCSTYLDARTASEEELSRQVADMVKEATKLLLEWQRVTVTYPGGGGSCLYQPVGLALSNFGWSIISDRRTCKVRAFG